MYCKQTEPGEIHGISDSMTVTLFQKTMTLQEKLCVACCNFGLRYYFMLNSEWNERIYFDTYVHWFLIFEVIDNIPWVFCSDVLVQGDHGGGKTPQPSIGCYQRNTSKCYHGFLYCCHGSWYCCVPVLILPSLSHCSYPLSECDRELVVWESPGPGEFLAAVARAGLSAPAPPDHGSRPPGSTVSTWELAPFHCARWEPGSGAHYPTCGKLYFCHFVVHVNLSEKTSIMSSCVVLITWFLGGWHRSDR